MCTIVSPVEAIVSVPSPGVLLPHLLRRFPSVSKTKTGTLPRLKTYTLQRAARVQKSWGSRATRERERERERELVLRLR
jgi:hypothetical protein